jgi:hypothetical protein
LTQKGGRFLQSKINREQLVLIKHGELERWLPVEEQYLLRSINVWFLDLNRDWSPCFSLRCGMAAVLHYLVVLGPEQVPRREPLEALLRHALARRRRCEADRLREQGDLQASLRQHYHAVGGNATAHSAARAATGAADTETSSLFFGAISSKSLLDLFAKTGSGQAWVKLR